MTARLHRRRRAVAEGSGVGGWRYITQKKIEEQVGGEEEEERGEEGGEEEEQDNKAQNIQDTDEQQ